jgi:hypothetical protein
VDQRRFILTRLKIFGVFFSASILFILIRCCYCIAKLGQGYGGSLFYKESLFIALESVIVILAVFALNIAQLGTVLSYIGKFLFVLTVAGFAFQNRTQKADTTYSNKLEHEPSS